MTTSRQFPIATRGWAAGTAALGLLTLTRPTQLAAAVSRGEKTPAAYVLRVLGARQVAQGAVLAIRPLPLLAAGGAAVDALHALSMVGLALVVPQYRKSALTSAATAGASAAVGAVILRRLGR